MTELENQTERQDIAEMFARLKDLPASGRVVQSALRETRDPACTSRRLESILEADAGTTADVLRLANSAYYGVRGEVRALSMAVTVIGHRRLIVLLRHLLAGKLLETIEPRSEAGRRARLVALSAGTVSSEMARLGMAADPNEVMVAGLLHNVGELALLSEVPEDELAGLDQWLAAPGAEPRITVAGITVKGIDSLDAGSWLLQSWGFPSPYVAAARYWTNPESSELSSIERDYAAFVHLGAWAGRAWVCGRDSGEALCAVSGSVFDLTGVTPDDFAAAFEQIQHGMENLSGSLSPASDLNPLDSSNQGEQSDEPQGGHASRG